MAILMLKALQSTLRATSASDRDEVLDLAHYEVPPQVPGSTASKAPVIPLDTTHAPAVRAFLADRQEGMTGRQVALARAVMMARQVC